MRRPRTLYLLAVLLAALVAMVSVKLSVAQYPPCSPPQPLAGTNGASWATGNVTVIINAIDFPTSDQQQAIQQAFTTWQNAHTNSGVTFSFTTGSDPQHANGTFYVHRGPTTTGGATSISNTGSPATEGNITTAASTVLDLTMSRVATLTNVMLHEIGHTFGLGDCLDCAQGSTIMSRYQNDCFCPSFPCDQNAPFNGMRWGCPPLQAPTQCDETAVTQYGHYPTPTPTPESCPSTDCNAGGSEFPVDYCAYPGIGCPSNYVATGSCCQPYNITPVIIDVDGSGFHLTSASDGVWFDFYGTGTRVKISWTEHSSTNTWLVLDRNGNGTIDNGSELFGNFTPQPEPPDGEEKNGFLALAEYDKAEKGGNGDRLITSSDTIFQWLRLWQDINHNGISEPSELHTFTELGLANLELDYKISKSTDQYGNQFRYRTKVKDVNGAQVGRWAWDVFLMGLN